MPRFCTVLRPNGQPCHARNRPGQSLCLRHSPDYARPPRACAYLTAQGLRCHAEPLRGHDYCFAHSPRNHQRRYPAVRVAPREIDLSARASSQNINSLPQTNASNT
jgi:hypothetical protein